MSDPLTFKPENLDQSLWDAFAQHRDTFDGVNAAEPRNLPAVIGAAKDMCESMAKIVLITRGETVGSAAKYPHTISEAHRLVGLRPRDLAADEASRAIAQSLMSLASTLGDLRRDFGTGHGRAEPVYATVDHAELAVDAARSWCRFMLRRLPTFLFGLVEPIIIQLHSGVWYSGELTARLGAVAWDSISSEDARRIGVAVGQRAMRQTFNVRIDGIEAIIADPSIVSAEYIAGVIQGQLFSVDGTLTTTKTAVLRIIELLRAHPAPNEVLVETSRIAVDSSWRQATDSSDSLTDVIQCARVHSFKLKGESRATWETMWDEIERLLVTGHPF